MNFPENEKFPYSFPIADTHAHYDDKKFDDVRDELLGKMKDFGVEFILNNAINCHRSAKDVLDMANKYDICYAAIGVHPECLNEIPAPVDLGIYYAIVHVADTVNYSAWKSEPISFEIVKVLPISFLAVITKEAICAFDTLTEGDILCSVLNNDGSVTEVDPSLVNIVYENGSCFARTDKGVILSYDKYTITLPIEVGYANYDMSSVRWVNTTQVYDGNEKQPSLEGLPEGVRVVEYIGCNNVNAGSYTVYAVFDYDKENYNQPELSPCELVIEKCMVTVPQSVYSLSTLTV